MRILFIGDIFGRSGRDALQKHLPDLKQKLKTDVIIVNGENSAHGSGITSDMCKAYYKLGADCITTGNHIWRLKETIFYIDKDPKLIRAINYPEGTPGKGYYIHELYDGRKIMVIHALGRVYMDALDDPFLLVRELVDKYSLGNKVHAIFVDFHGEATSEKMAFAQYLDGDVSAVVGTHTHIPTADNRILAKGTAYQTDAGMTGDYDSVIGSKKEVPIQRFVKKLTTERMSPAEGEATLCGVFVETDDKTGLAKQIVPIRVGPYLTESLLDNLG